MRQRFYFRGKNCPKMCLKINRSVKRRDIGRVNWELFATGYGLLVVDVPPRKTSPEARSEEKRMFSQARKNSAWAKKKIGERSKLR